MADEGAVIRSVAGSWLGEYSYPGSTIGSNFEVVFIQSGTALEGNILDAGGLGEARATGSFAYPIINFRKTYVAPGYEPIVYEGRMVEDGKAMVGYWRIELDPDEEPMYGGWMMFKESGEEKFDLKELIAKYPLEEQIESGRRVAREKRAV